MFGGASNILGNSAKDMAGLSSPFRLPGQFPNFPNYQRPLPAHSPLAAHMKNASSSSSSSSNPIAAHMMSNPYQYPANYGLNAASYGAAGGAAAMNTNYLQANAAAAAGQSQNSAAYLNQTNDRFRQQFQQNQFRKTWNFDTHTVYPRSLDPIYKVRIQVFVLTLKLKFESICPDYN